MYRDFASLDLGPQVGQSDGIRGRRVTRAPDWSVVIPFFNEAPYLANTIASLAAQSVPFTLVLVDNASTDGSADVARTTAEAYGLDYRLITERRPGKVHALHAGMTLVETRFVATCDADTWYPVDYLKAAGALLARAGHVAAGAYFVQPDWTMAQVWRTARRVQRAARLMPRQCHTGGAGQVFRTAALRRAGGFDPHRWNFVLEDHEIVHQVLKRGRMGYADDFWCVPSPRDRKRGSTRWTLLERLTYHATASRAGDWFFNNFLAPRLAGRALLSDRLRETPYQTPQTAPQHSWIDHGTPYPVCG